MIRPHARRILITALLVLPAVASAQTIQPPFDASYSFADLGSVPGVPLNYGGITFHPTNANVILIGGSAANPTGQVYAIGVVRAANQHVVGFSGTATAYAAAPNIDGGLQYGPNNVLFYTGYPIHVLGQIPLGQTAPTKIIALSSLGIAGSVGAFQIVPPGYPGAGNVKIAPYNNGQWHTAQLQSDGTGTYDLVNVVAGPTIVGGPEGILFPPAGSPLLTDFGNVLVCEWATGNVVVYALDANGDPVVATRQIMMSGLSGAEGATIDPVTGDFLFSTYGFGNKVIAIRGFAVPTCGGTSQAYGPSTAGSGGFTPALTVVGTPCIGNALSALSLAQGIGGAPTVLFMGLAPASVPAPAYGGTLLVAPILVNSFPIGGPPGAPGTGAVTLPIPIPNDAVLVGVSVFLQAILSDAGAPKNFSFTRGLQVTIG